MENSSQKIWKYMDMAKFISVLSNESLYFACPTEFNDPYEGYVPMSYAKAFAEKKIKDIDAKLSERDEVLRKKATLNLTFQEEQYLKCKLNEIEHAFDEWDKSLETEIIEKKTKKGISCWHKSDHESEAMWRLYSTAGQGIAIESTVGQLKASISHETGLEIKSVDYLAVDAPISEKIGKLDTLFIKRKFFQHEQELRAVISLKKPGKGELVKCDLDQLINHIHVSPLVEPFIKEVVQDICDGTIKKRINKPVTRSKLLDKPNYRITALAERKNPQIFMAMNKTQVSPKKRAIGYSRLSAAMLIFAPRQLLLLCSKYTSS